jgi:hypothetical protein
MQQNSDTQKDSLTQRSTTMSLAKRNLALADKIQQMRLTIAPIVHVDTGIAPPQFPPTMLHLFLLTESQLDSMAEYYSQTALDPTPTSLTFAYPQTMNWNKSFLSREPALPENCKLSDLERLRVKMRMFAGFLGMRGAETPRWEIERQVEILRAKIELSVREEDQKRAKGKMFGGLSRL